jgi:pimeloyl-ACP methyl ester carboxylesterase
MRTPSLVLLATLLVCPPATGDPPARPRGVEVARVTFPVVLSDGSVCAVAGWLHSRGRPQSRTLQLLVHGAGFNHAYWDVPDPGDGNSYSYAQYMAERNHAVLAIDLPGTGESCQPDGDLFDLEQATSTVRQVAASLRQADNPTGAAFKRLVLVGYSNGAVTAIRAQGTYHVADALVTTGWVHGCRGLPVDPSDPLLQEVLAEPYVLLPAATRPPLLFHLPFMTPQMIAYDAAHLMERVPRAQFLDLLGVHFDVTARCADGSRTPLTRSALVTGPVLVQAGAHDVAIAPGAIVDQAPTEASFYPLASRVDVMVLADLGHAFNLHTSHLAGWDAIDHWIHDHLR